MTACEVQSLDKSTAFTGSQVSSEPSSLWKAAYEHPVATGLAVTATAAAITGSVLTRGRLAELLAPESKGVLVVEAAPCMGKAMTTALQEQGQAVTWVTEISRLRPLTGLTSTGEQVGLNLRRFHTAFLDPNHVSKVAPEFGDIAPIFRNNNVRTIGTSVLDTVNQKMLASGIDAAGNKPIVLASLVGKKLDLLEGIRNPGNTQTVFDWMKPRFNSPELAGVKKQTEDLLAQSMKVQS